MTRGIVYDDGTESLVVDWDAPDEHGFIRLSDAGHALLAANVAAAVELVAEPSPSDRAAAIIAKLRGDK